VRITRTRAGAALTAAVLLAGLAGVGSASAGTDAPAAPDSSAGGAGQRGGTLNYLVPIESPSMDPCAWIYSGQGTNGLRAVAIYDSLIRYNPDTSNYDFHMAESLTPNDDFTKWTLVLKPDVVFSDGTPLDAEAVKYNWARLGEPDRNCQMAGYVANIASMDVVDPLTLDITLATPSATFIEDVAARLGNVIGSPTAMDALGDDFGTAPIGAGPFVVDSWVKDDKMVLVRNDSYYLADEGLPYLDSVVIRPLIDPEQRMAALDSGEADLAAEQIGTYLQQGVEDGYGVSQFYMQGAESMMFNLNQPPFDDLRARQAFVMSVDTSQLVDVVWDGSLEPADGFFYPPSPWDDPSVTWPGADCEAAGKLWAELAEENGGPVTFTIGVFSINQPPSAEFMQAAISQCGGDNVDVSVDAVDAAAAAERYFAGNFQVHGWGIQTVNRPESILRQLRCADPRNPTGFCSEEMDALLDQSIVEDDPAVLAPLYSQVEQILADQLPAFFFKRTVVGGIYQTDVMGVSIFEDGILPLEEVWLDR